MASKQTWIEQKKYNNEILKKIEHSHRNLKLYPKFTKLDGRKFIDLNNYKE